MPEASATVSVTVLLPRSAHVKAVLERLDAVTLQLSAELAVTLAVVSVAVPLLVAALRLSVKFAQVTVGLVVSTTVTTATQLRVLPEASVAVRVTLLVPRSAQANAVLLSVNVVPVQLSLDESVILPGASVALPPLTTLLSVRVKGLQATFGLMESRTVTTEVHASVLPEKSVTVRVAVMGVPTLEQLTLGLAGEVTISVLIPEGQPGLGSSAELLLIKVDVIVAADPTR